MLIDRFTKIMVLLSLFLVIGVGNVSAKKMYRWIDDEGRVIFSDLVPQDQIKHKREALNDNARIVEVVEEAKTKEQIELENRLKLLRLQQKKIINKQKNHDKVLLSTYRSVGDMKMALKGKMNAMEAQWKVVEGNLVGLEQQLAQQQSQAADYDRRGVKIPEDLLADIRATREQIENTKIEIARHLTNKQRTKKAFEEDIDRFIFLTQSKIDANKLSLKSAEQKASSELGLYICENRFQCNKAWRIARQFVDKYSSTAEDIDTDYLIMRGAPRSNDDLSLSVSKLDLENGRQQFFLDIRCRQSTSGLELCAGPMVKLIRHSFNDFIESALASEQ